MTAATDRALTALEAAGIELQNSRPDPTGPRHWFRGPSDPTIHGAAELELVAHYATIAYETGREAGREEWRRKTRGGEA